MTQNISARRGAAIAGFAALVLLVLVAAFDNQWTEKWRAGRATAGGNTMHSWTSGPVRGLSVLNWRATKLDGEPARIYAAMLAEPLIAVLLTFLLLMLVCRGVAAQRGRWSLFLGSWFATGLGAALALIAAAAIAGSTAVAGTLGTGDDSSFSRGDTYYGLLESGLVFGLFAGWLVGFVAVLVYGSTEGSEELGTTREYAPPGYDYSSAASSSGMDYSFAPTTPYSSSSAGYGGGGYGSAAEAPTEVTTQPTDSDPFGGARSY
jgi:hypothetical protein